MKKKELPTMTKDKALKIDAENPWPFYVAKDEETDLWSVCGVNSNFAYSNHCVYEEAAKVAKEMEDRLYKKRKAQ